MHAAYVGTLDPYEAELPSGSKYPIFTDSGPKKLPLRVCFLGPKTLNIGYPGPFLGWGRELFQGLHQEGQVAVPLWKQIPKSQSCHTQRYIVRYIYIDMYMIFEPSFHTLCQRNMERGPVWIAVLFEEGPFRVRY